MSRRHASEFARDVRLDFHLGHGIKLSVHKSGVSVKFKRKNILKKYEMLQLIIMAWMSGSPIS
jgi:hypothetical protein